MTKATMKAPSRREVMRGLGLSTAAAALVPVLGGRSEAAAMPRRLLLVFSSNGSIPSQFWPTGGEKDFKFTPGSILEPLAKFRDDLVIPKDLKRTFHSLGGTHERGMGSLWTGSRLNPGDQEEGGGWPAGPSIDQILGKALPRETAFQTLEVGVQHDGAGRNGGTMRQMFFAGPDQPVAPESNPYKLFDRLMGAGGARPAVELARIRARRQSVIDGVREELARLAVKIDKTDRLKIDAHLESLRSVEVRLQKTPAVAAACATKPSGTIDLANYDNFPTLCQIQMDMVVGALACDRSRIVGLQFSRAYSQIRHKWAGVDEEHHGASHDGSAAGDAKMTKVNRWYAERLAYLLEKLKTTPEGTGSLLDNTLVVYAAELAHGATHDPNPACAFLAGRLGGRLRTGRFIDYKQGTNWTQLLTSICHAMGHPIAKVGDLGPGGVIPGLFDL